MSAPAIVGLDHVQVAIPEDGEAAAREFHLGILGLAESAKPEALRGRGGFRAETSGAPVHVGIDPDRPARKAHVVLATRDLDAVARALEDAGPRPVTRAAAARRLFTEDLAGNRTEIVETP